MIQLLAVSSSIYSLNNLLTKYPFNETPHHHVHSSRGHDGLETFDPLETAVQLLSVRLQQLELLKKLCCDVILCLIHFHTVSQTKS